MLPLLLLLLFSAGCVIVALSTRDRDHDLQRPEEHEHVAKRGESCVLLHTAIVVTAFLQLRETRYKVWYHPTDGVHGLCFLFRTRHIVRVCASLFLSCIALVCERVLAYALFFCSNLFARVAPPF